MPKPYHGQGRGGNPIEALRAAIDDAWQKAKDDGKQGVELVVEPGSWRVKGQNPINWTSIVLIDPADNS